jgi:hypothetical protein
MTDARLPAVSLVAVAGRRQRTMELAKEIEDRKPFATSGVTQAFLVLCQGLTILGSDAKKSQQCPIKMVEHP